MILLVVYNEIKRNGVLQAVRTVLDFESPINIIDDVAGDRLRILVSNIVNADIDALAGILESKLALNFPTHAENHKARHLSGGADAFTSTDLIEAIVKRLRESGGDNLLLGVVADGEFLKRSGTNIVGTATPAPNIKQTEVDFGATPISNATFTVTDADVSPTSQLLAQVAFEAPTGKDVDEIEMDNLQIRCKPATGSFDMYIETADGSYLADKFKINYLVG